MYIMYRHVYIHMYIYIYVLIAPPPPAPRVLAPNLARLPAPLNSSAGPASGAKGGGSRKLASQILSFQMQGSSKGNYRVP